MDSVCQDFTECGRGGMTDGVSDSVSQSQSVSAASPVTEPVPAVTPVRPLTLSSVAESQSKRKNE